MMNYVLYIKATQLNVWVTFRKLWNRISPIYVDISDRKTIWGDLVFGNHVGNHGDQATRPGRNLGRCGIR